MSLINAIADNLVSDCNSYLSTACQALNEFKNVSSNANECLKVAAININSQYAEDNGLHVASCGIHPSLRLQLGMVYTVGAEKYTDRDENGNITYNGANNWRLGMSWMSILDSTFRHIEAYTLGEDLDSETQCHHLAHALWNVYALIDHVKHHPEKDDRYTPMVLRIGLDIDGVLADFEKAFLEYMGKQGHEITSWNDPLFRKYFKLVSDDHSFWVNLDKTEDLKNKPLGFNPKVYITARPVPTEVTEYWLFEKNHFPMAPVETVGHDNSKVEICKKYKLDLFVDDAYHNYEELNRAGVPCLLRTRKHNTSYNVGSRRISSVHDLEKIWS